MLINFKTISGLEIWILNIPDISRFARNKKLKHFRSDFRFQISSHLDHKGQQNNLMVNFQSGAIQDAERIDEPVNVSFVEPVNVSFVCSCWIV